MKFNIRHLLVTMSCVAGIATWCHHWYGVACNLLTGIFRIELLAFMVFCLMAVICHALGSRFGD